MKNLNLKNKVPLVLEKKNLNYEISASKNCILN